MGLLPLWLHPLHLVLSRRCHVAPLHGGCGRASEHWCRCHFNQLASTSGIKAKNYPLDYVTNRLSMSGLRQTLSLLTQNHAFVNSKFACSTLSLLPHLFFQKAELVIICKQHYPGMNTSLPCSWAPIEHHI